MKKFYRYLYYVDPRFENCRYTPSDILPKQSKLLGSVCTLTCELVPEDKYKDLGGGLKADWRYGKISFEPESLAAIGWDEETMKAMAMGISQQFSLSFPTKEEVAAQLRSFTTLTETEPGLFLLSEAVTEGPFPREARYIDCR